MSDMNSKTRLMRMNNMTAASMLLILAAGKGALPAAMAADTGTTRSSSSATAPARQSARLPAPPVTGTAPTQSPTAPSVVPAAPATRVPAIPKAQAGGPAPILILKTGPMILPKPDYAIGLDWQQEYENTAMAWRFRIENRGMATPNSQSSGNPFYPQTSASLAISVALPCPGTGNWKKLASIPLPSLKAGESVISTPYRMPDSTAGKGCRFRAAIEGPANDANSTNNVMHMFSKTVSLPDLAVGSAPYMGGPGGGLQVKNIGKAPAGPSQFHFSCFSSISDVSCGKLHAKYLPKLDLDVPVPALNPGQGFTVMESTPGGAKGPPAGVSWNGQADYKKEVVESSENNNIKFGRK
ncbi:MAG: hypothetical protein NUV55_00060 [Sulfuricaulis sp.]|uniref:hypothetical protein n=1 Tax=Sulfuricaulis sp. TaxID=2003553 RepID=UPI0025F3FBB5|nr:hypothetical protein [Sulfuricaulis sp.]MCR4345591.1 hypothetical protein [Sulfuricaulis sp.]